MKKFRFIQRIVSTMLIIAMVATEVPAMVYAAEPEVKDGFGDEGISSDDSIGGGDIDIPDLDEDGNKSEADEVIDEITDGDENDDAIGEDVAEDTAEDEDAEEVAADAEEEPSPDTLLEEDEVIEELGSDVSYKVLVNLNDIFDYDGYVAGCRMDNVDITLYPYEKVVDEEAEITDEDVIDEASLSAEDGIYSFTELNFSGDGKYAIVIELNYDSEVVSAYYNNLAYMNKAPHFFIKTSDDSKIDLSNISSDKFPFPSQYVYELNAGQFQNYNVSETDGSYELDIEAEYTDASYETLAVEFGGEISSESFFADTIVVMDNAIEDSIAIASRDPEMSWSGVPDFPRCIPEYSDEVGLSLYLNFYLNDMPVDLPDSLIPYFEVDCGEAEPKQIYGEDGVYNLSADEINNIVTKTHEKGYTYKPLKLRFKKDITPEKYVLNINAKEVLGYDYGSGNSLVELNIKECDLEGWLSGYSVPLDEKTFYVSAFSADNEETYSFESLVTDNISDDIVLSIHQGIINNYVDILGNADVNFVVYVIDEDGQKHKLERRVKDTSSYNVDVQYTISPELFEQYAVISDDRSSTLNISVELEDIYSEKIVFSIDNEFWSGQIGATRVNINKVPDRNNDMDEQIAYFSNEQGWVYPSPGSVGEPLFTFANNNHDAELRLRTEYIDSNNYENIDIYSKYIPYIEVYTGEDYEHRVQNKIYMTGTDFVIPAEVLNNIVTETQYKSKPSGGTQKLVYKPIMFKFESVEGMDESDIVKLSVSKEGLPSGASFTDCSSKVYMDLNLWAGGQEYAVNKKGYFSSQYSDGVFADLDTILSYWNIHYRLTGVVLSGEGVEPKTLTMAENPEAFETSGYEVRVNLGHLRGYTKLKLIVNKVSYSNLRIYQKNKICDFGYRIYNANGALLAQGTDVSEIGETFTSAGNVYVYFDDATGKYSLTRLYNIWTKKYTYPEKSGNFAGAFKIPLVKDGGVTMTMDIAVKPQNGSFKAYLGEGTKIIFGKGVTKNADGSYQINNVGTVTATIRVDGKHWLSDIKMGNQSQIQLWDPNKYVYGSDSSSTYQEYVVNFDAAELIQAKAFRVNTYERSVRVGLAYDKDAVNVTVNSGAQGIALGVDQKDLYDRGEQPWEPLMYAPDGTNYTYRNQFDLGYGDNYTFSATAKSGYKVNSVEIINCSDWTGRDVKKGASSASLSLKYDSGYEYIVVVRSEPLTSLMMSTDGTSFSKAPSGIKAEIDGEYYFRLYSGNPDAADPVMKELASVTVLDGKSNVTAAFNAATVDDETYKISVPVKYAGKKLTVNVKAADGETKAVTLTTDTKLTSLTVAKKSGDPAIAEESRTLTAQLGKTSSYALAYNKGVNIASLRAEIDTVCTVTEDGGDPIANPVGSAEGYGVSVSFNSNTLNVASKLVTDGEGGKGVKPVSAVVNFYYGAIADPVGSYVFNFDENYIRNAAEPAVSYVSATDRTIDVKLTLPKNIVASENMYYAVLFTPKGYALPVPPVDYVKIVPARGASQVETLNPQPEAAEGEGVKADYMVGAMICYAAKTPTALDIFNATFDETTIAGNLPNKQVIMSTLEPSYETKFTLTKGATSLFAGTSGDKVVGTAKLSAKTTYRELTDAKIVSAPSGYDKSKTMAADDVMVVGISDTNPLQVVVKSVGKYVKPGKYTIQASVKQGTNVVPVTANISITIKTDTDLDRCSVTASTKQVRKVANKAVTVKGSLNTVNYQGKKAKPKKTVWTIFDAAGNTPAPGSFLQTAIASKKLTIKNGTVTIAKNFIASPVESENVFTIGAVVTNTAGQVRTVVSAPVEISSKAQVIDHLCIVMPGAPDTVISEGNMSEALTTDKLTGAVIKAYDANGDIIDAVSYKLTGKTKSVTVNGTTGAITGFGKPGTSTIQVTTTDGGKNSKTIQVKTKYYDGELYLVNSDRYTINEWDDVSPLFNTVPTLGWEIYVAVNIGTEEVPDYKILGEPGFVSPMVSYTLKAASGKLASVKKTVGGVDGYCYTPGKRYDSITLKNNVNAESTREYKIDNRACTLNDKGRALPALSLKSNKGTILANYNTPAEGVPQSLSLTVKGWKPAVYSSIRVDFDYTDVYKSTANLNRYADVAFKLGILSLVSVDDKGNFKLIFGDNIPAGTYKLKLQATDNFSEAASKEIPFTLTVKAAAKGSYTMGTTYVLTLEDEGAGDVVAKEISPVVTKAKNLRALTGETKPVFSNLKDANIGGKVHEMSTYFEISAEGNIVLKDDTSVRYDTALGRDRTDMEQVEYLKNLYGTKIYGWVTVSAYDLSGNPVNQTKLISIAY